PAVVSESLAESTGYRENFPHQLIDVPPSDVLLPAACLPVYPFLRGRALPASVLVTASCARHEGGAWEAPYRLRTFHMMELVMVGSAAYVGAVRAEVAEFFERTLPRLGLPGEMVAATDAFYLPGGSGSRMIQKLKELKREYVASHSGTVLCSINNHERYFASRFGLGDDGTETGCIAFGIERLALASLASWGEKEESWPLELRPE
ncbi:MAG TPA: hypothetical protein VFB34_06650, partial [Chloroflexota bacterium]|nr:hypothetical protein [Chloroflexota bacterium]